MGLAKRNSCNAMMESFIIGILKTVLVSYCKLFAMVRCKERLVIDDDNLTTQHALYILQVVH